MNEAACYTARMQSAAGAGLRERTNDGMPVRFRIAALSGGRAGRKLTPVSAARFSVACFGCVQAAVRGGLSQVVGLCRPEGRLRVSGFGCAASRMAFAAFGLQNGRRGGVVPAVRRCAKLRRIARV